jgi:uncharacterized membrane protein YphA (DoxX/SURF4 family)
MTTLANEDRFTNTWDGAVLALRVALGLMFLVAGLKLIIPAPFGLGNNRDQLVSGFTDPVTGFMAPWSVQFLTDHGATVSASLFGQGVLEVLLAVALLAGIATPRLAMVATMMLVMFTMLTPTGGQIRLSRDLALAAAAIALMYWGGGRWSVDGWYRRRTPHLDTGWARIAGLANVARGGKRDRGLLVIRLGMMFALGASALFASGVFANPMNTSLPPAILLISAALLAVGIGARYLMGGIAAWLLAISIGKSASLGLLIGAENIKRELALAAIAAVYVAIGPDRWTVPRPKRLRCRDVSDLLSAYVDGELPYQHRSAVEFHIADCPDCWAYLVTYRQTVELGRELSDLDMPAEMYQRLSVLVADAASEGKQP